MNRRDLTADELRRKVSYDPQSGEFRWIASASNVAANGSIAGCVRAQDGYLQIKIGSYLNLAHRLAWLYVHGAWPVHNIDHINGNRADNRLANLRDIPQAQNLQNQRRAASCSKTGILGVSPYGGRFRAALVVDKKQKALGYFDTVEEAQAAYISAKRLYHPAGTL